MIRKEFGFNEPPLLERVREHGFKTFTGSANYDLNIISLRNPSVVPNSFDDLMFVIHKEDGLWVQYIFPCTTDPGQYHLNNPSRVAGTAIMMHPQQCRGVYKLDLHGGSYLALCQRNGKVKVWRDNNKDQVLDREGDEHQGYGINIHRASALRTTENVERYSAGCSVIANPEDFNIFIDLCQKQTEINGWDTFTYTILLGTSDDFSP
tara:strand:+ start:319 stop:939 length:621 start_codon:yes stop_codon:yes gene_type:complete